MGREGKGGLERRTRGILVLAAVIIGKEDEEMVGSGRGKVVGMEFWAGGKILDQRQIFGVREEFRHERKFRRGHEGIFLRGNRGVLSMMGSLRGRRGIL